MLRHYAKTQRQENKAHFRTNRLWSWRIEYKVPREFSAETAEAGLWEVIRSRRRTPTSGLVSVTHLCLTLLDPMDCSSPGSSIHGILQARTLEWVAYHFSRGSSWPRIQTGVSCIAGRFFTNWAIREALAKALIKTKQFSLPIFWKVRGESVVLEEPSISFSLLGLQCPDCPLRNYPAHRE